MLKKFMVVTAVACVLMACGNNNAEGETTATETNAPATTEATAPQEQLTASGISVEDADKGLDLISKSDCLTCHKIEDRLVGPSYKEVANKYPVNDSTFGYLAGKIIKGGAGVWGQTPMSPHEGLSEEDARQMAKYVMSHKD